MNCALNLKDSSVLVSDLHLTGATRDEYRWDIFPWLLELVKQHSIPNVVILGDLTDAKDYHSSVLVNRICTNLMLLAETCCVWVLRGNHDGIDPNTPYFMFLNGLKNVFMIHQPQAEGGVMFLPHSRDPVHDWEHLDLAKYEMVFAHVTVSGAVAENEMALEGAPISIFNGVKQVYSGDVHVPQTRKNVEYVGAPYPIRFGDKYQGRCLWLDGGEVKPLHYRTIARCKLILTPRELADGAALSMLRPGDQVKIVIRLPQSELVSWLEHRNAVQQACADAQVEVHGMELEVIGTRAGGEGGTPPTERTKLSTRDVFNQYCAKENLGADLVEVGAAILEQVND